MKGSTLAVQSFDTTHFTTRGEAIPIAERVASAAGGAVGFSVSDTATLLYRSDSSSQSHPVWVDRSGRQLGEAAPPGAYDELVLSPDGKRLAFNRTAANTDVWLMDLDRRISSRLTF